MPVLVVLRLLSGVHKRLETHAALGVWACSVLKSEEHPGEALPYLTGQINIQRTEKEILRAGGRKLVVKAVITAVGERLQTWSVASSVSTGFLSPPVSIQRTAKNLSITNVLRWKRVHIFGIWAVAFVLPLKTSPLEFMEHLCTSLWWRCREALKMEQTSATHLVVPRQSPSECVLCHLKYAPV